MQITGLESERKIVAAGSQEVTRGVLLSDPHEQLCSPGFRRILLVITALGDVSRALNVACALADRSQGEVVVLEGPSQTRGIQSLVSPSSRLNQANKIDLLEVHRSCLDAVTIDHVAHEYACDLVILGMKGQTRGLRMANGSIGEGVFRRLTCPTLLLGPKIRSVRSAEPGGPVILATSFRDGNMAAIELASRIAHLVGSPLACVHVLPADMADSTKGCHIVPQIMRDALVAGAKENHVTVSPEQCHILYGRSVSDALVQFAALRKAHFIVLGVRRSGSVVSHLPAGIASSVIQCAPCPVLTLASPVRDMN